MQYLGRAKDPSEFVKHGSREAIIEIELQRNSSMRRNPVITRTIKKDTNGSTFLTNGKQTTGREVQLLANSFNIQIDNLCQFLPQDKVVDFAQLSPIDLLASTQRAVAGPEMTRHQENLKKLRANQISLLTDDKEAHARLANLENRQALQQTEVERVRERTKVKLRLERLERSRIMLQYREATGIARTEEHKAKKLALELKELKVASAPILAKLRSGQQYEAKARDARAKVEAELKASLHTCDIVTKEITRIDDRMKEESDKIEAEKTGVSKKKEKIAREQGKLRDFQRQKTEAPASFDIRDLSNEIQELRRQMAGFQSAADDLKPRRQELREQGEKRAKEAKVLQTKLDTFGSLSSQMEDSLKKLSPQTWEAWDWVQKNQSQFSQHVYGPPMVECSLKNPAMADAVESILQMSDFKFITVQNKADFQVLQKRLFSPKSSEGLGLHDVSLRECNTDSLDQFKPPMTEEEMRRLGLSGWAIDHLQGPNTVLAQLCVERSLHRCGVSTTEPTQQQHDELARTDIQSYVAGQKVYQFLRRKEYGAAGTSARVIDVHRARYWTNQAVDLGRKAALQREYNEAKGEAVAFADQFKEVSKQVKEIEAQQKEMMGEIDRKKTEKDAIQESQAQYNALDFKMASLENSIKSLREQLRTVGTRVSGHQEELDALLIEKTEAVLGFAAASREVRSHTQAQLETDVVVIEAVSDLQVAEAQNKEVVEDMQKKQAEHATAKELYRQQREVALKTKTAAQRVHAEATKLGDEGDPSFLELLEYVCQELKTMDNLEPEIDAEKAKLELTEGGNADIIAEFERRAKDIQALRAQVQDANKRQEESQKAIENVRSKWEPRLDEVVARINEAFSDSFARIGCAGQVAVYKASSTDPSECTEDAGGVENGLDFEHWAIHVSVKFRESEPLSLLDSRRQSGGERAVSTIFYLMALQSLSRAPFRVVDEINQGMDPRNERMVHGRMVDIAADDGGSQYFLITPKLLSGLKYRRGMTVLCIASGENVPAARERDEDGEWQDGPKVDFRLFASRARELGLGGAGGRRIDSGMELGRSGSQATSVGA